MPVGVTGGAHLDGEIKPALLRLSPELHLCDIHPTKTAERFRHIQHCVIVVLSGIAHQRHPIGIAVVAGDTAKLGFLKFHRLQGFPLVMDSVGVSVPGLFLYPLKKRQIRRIGAVELRKIHNAHLLASLHKVFPLQIHQAAVQHHRDSGIYFISVISADIIGGAFFQKGALPFSLDIQIVQQHAVFIHNVGGLHPPLMHMDFIRVYSFIVMLHIAPRRCAGNPDVQIGPTLFHLQQMMILNGADHLIHLIFAVKLHPYRNISKGPIGLPGLRHHNFVRGNYLEIDLAVVIVIGGGIGHRNIQIPVIGTGGAQRLVGIGTHRYIDAAVDHLPVCQLPVGGPHLQGGMQI